MRVLLAVVLLAGCTACGPSYLERLRAEEAARQAAVCQADPQGCILAQYLSAEVDAEMAAQQQGQAVPPQRVFIHRWLVPGGRNSPAPIGYIDY